MDATTTLSMLSTAIGTASGVVDLFKSANELRGARDEQVAAAKEKLLQVKEALYASKDTIFTLKDQVAELVNQIKQLKIQIARREEHSLRQVGPGAFAYIAKDAADAVKNGPWLCQSCFDEGKTAVLQFSEQDWHFDAFKCPRCGATIRVPNNQKMAAMTAPRQARAEDDDFF